MPGVRQLSLMYQDDNPTCKATYASLCVHRDELDPDDVSSRLGIVPSKAHRTGDEYRYGYVVPTGGWFLSSQEQVESKDVCRHVVWILDRLAGKEAELLRLQDEGHEMYVFCYWLSASGHGGPELSHEVMQRLVSLRLDIAFDVY